MHQTSAIDSLATQISMYGDFVGTDDNVQHESIKNSLCSAMRARSLAALGRSITRDNQAKGKFGFLLPFVERAYNHEIRDMMGELLQTNFYGSDDFETKPLQPHKLCDHHPPTIRSFSLTSFSGEAVVIKIEEAYQALLDLEPTSDQYRYIEMLMEKCVTIFSLKLIRTAIEGASDSTVENCCCCCFGKFSSGDYLNAERKIEHELNDQPFQKY